MQGVAVVAVPFAWGFCCMLSLSSSGVITLADTCLFKVESGVFRFKDPSAGEDRECSVMHRGICDDVGKVAAGGSLNILEGGIDDGDDIDVWLMQLADEL